MIKNRVSLSIIATSTVMALSQSVMAADHDEFLNRLTRESARDFRTITKVQQMTTQAVIANESAQPVAPVNATTMSATTLEPIKLPISFKIGAGYFRDADNVGVLYTPFSLMYKASEKLKIGISGDGYNWISVPGESKVSGLADLKVIAAYSFSDQISGTAVAIVPTGAPGGSEDGAQAMVVSYGTNLNENIGIYGQVTAVRLNKVGEGINRWGQKAYAQIYYQLNPSVTIGAALTHKNRGGTRSATEAELEIDFVLPSSWESAFVITKGLSVGRKGTEVSVEFKKQF